MSIKKFLREYPLVGYSTLGLAASACVVGAIRGFQEANGMVTDPALSSTLINVAICAPMGLEALAGAAYCGLIVPDDSTYGIIEKVGMTAGGAMIGAVAGGAAGFGGTPVGYGLGRLIGYAANRILT